MHVWSGRPSARTSHSARAPRRCACLAMGKEDACADLAPDPDGTATGLPPSRIALWSAKRAESPPGGTDMRFAGQHRGEKAPLGVNGPTRCSESLRSLNVRLSGLCTVWLHAAQMLPPSSIVCPISGACASSTLHSPRGAMPCVSAVLRVYKAERNYHVTSSDDTCYIQFRENELPRKCWWSARVRP